MASPSEEGRLAFEQMEAEVNPAAPPVPENSPLSANMREALVWAREHGVIEMDLPGVGRFSMRPGPEAQRPPTAEEIARALNGGTPSSSPKPRLAPGGYDEDTLFAAAPQR